MIYRINKIYKMYLVHLENLVNLYETNLYCAFAAASFGNVDDM